MAFAVRTTVTGEGNSYLSVSDANSYFTDRGNAAWTGSDTVKEQALVRATDYIDGRFAARFNDETLEAEEIPAQLEKATAEYAVRALAGALAPDPSVDASGFSVVNTRKKLGPMEKEFTVVGNVDSPMLFKPYPAADMLIAPLLKPFANRTYR